MNRGTARRGLRLLSGATALALAAGLALPAAAQDDILIGLVTKTEANPFFAKMREGAQAKADELGARLQSFAGKFDGDHDSQVSAVENLISAGASGILMVASDPAGIAPIVEQARQQGILVIALDTPLDPADAADATFATDNFKAGELIGAWAAKTVDDPATAKNGYLDEDDARIVGHFWSQGSEEGGRTGAETLLQKDPDLNVLYTINEPTAAGAYEALKAAGKDGSVVVTSVDGGCPGVENVKAGVIGATSMQYPLMMASLGVEAIVNFKKTGEKPAPTEGLDFFDTGVTLVTDHPVEGIESITSEEALAKCWG